MTLDPTDLTAVDVHVHVEKDSHGHLSLPQDMIDAAAEYFHAPTTRPSLAETADLYRSLRMAAVVFTVDARTFLGHAPNDVDELVREAREHTDVLIPFGSVDPHAADLHARVDTLVEAGVRGWKFHPSLQDFDPSDPAHRPMFEHLEAVGLPLIVHTGQTGIGAGMPGGRGIRLRLSNPMLLDDVAAAFPQLQIVLAHPSVPWQDEAISMATHKGNVWIDLSGWSPKYFPPQLVRNMNSLLQDKVLFGTDYPLLTPQKWLSAFDALDLKDGVRAKILRENALRLLRLR